MNELARRYEIIKPIGRGGMGTIYLARLVASRGFSKQVALKIATPNDENEEAIGRLRDEARVLGLLRHRAIVGVDGLVKLDGHWTVVMEYVAGLNLSALVEGYGRLPLGVALEIVAEVAAALDAAFNTRDPDGTQLCLQHRDIKPSNILVTPQGEVKVLDFGIARAEFGTRESITVDHHYGSSGYMAPERLDFIGHERSDVYSLGVVLFSLLTGKRFGKASTHPDRHRELVELRIRMLPDQAEAARLIQQMLSYDPAERPSAREVHRICMQLKPAHAETLHDWAEHTVPPLLNQHRDALQTGTYQSGQVLTERTLLTPTHARRATAHPYSDASLAQPVLPPTEEATGERQVLMPLLVGAGSALLLGLALLVFQGLAPSGPPTEVPVDASVPQIEVEATEPATEPAAVAEPVAVPLSNTDPAPARVVAEPAPPVAAFEGSSIRLQGDARRVQLVRGGRRYDLPGRVPRGHYSIVATFEGTDALPVGEIDVPASGSVSISCDALFVGCEVK